MPGIQEHYKARAERLQAMAAGQMAGFVFRNLASHAEARETCELWRCQKPGTAIWSFDIAVSSRGVAVYGDIDGLIFRGGYGLGLLAHHDVNYVISKLEHQCREVVFDKEAFLDICIDAAQEQVNDLHPDRDDESLRIKSDELSGVEGVVHAVHSLSRLIGEAGIADDVVAKMAALAVFLDEASSAEYEHSAREIFDGNPKILGSDTWEHRITQPSEGLLIRLAAARIAATAIIDQCREQPESGSVEPDDDVETSDADGGRDRLRG